MAKTNASGIQAAEQVKKDQPVSLWLSNQVLDIDLGHPKAGFTPDADHLSALNSMIIGIARAIKTIEKVVESDSSPEFEVQPIEALADAIILLAQLSGGVHDAIRAEAQS